MFINGRFGVAAIHLSQRRRRSFALTPWRQIFFAFASGIIGVICGITLYVVVLYAMARQ